MRKIYYILVIILLFNHLIIFSQAQEEIIIKDIFFPTILDASLTDSFGDGRYDHTHAGVDIMGEQMNPLYSAVDGVVSYIVIPEATWGYSVTIKGSDGYTYHYLHINNDTPGTDDGLGGEEFAYAPGIKRGAKVEAGQLLGWMGDSGNAESVAHHLHFEIRKPDKTPIDPYPSLLKALNPEIDYDVEVAMLESPNINIDKNLASNNQADCETGSLIKLVGTQTVYYCGANGKRYVFPNDKIYFSWYDDFVDINELNIEQLSQIPLGGSVTYRPGVKMVKIQTDPKVYAVERGGVLRWVRSRESAIKLYGEDWNQNIDDIPDSFFMNYMVGEPI